MIELMAPIRTTSTRAAAGVDGTVVAAGFYQGPRALVLGEEFHHNRHTDFFPDCSLPPAPRPVESGTLHETVIRLWLEAGSIPPWSRI